MSTFTRASATPKPTRHAAQPAAAGLCVLLLLAGCAPTSSEPVTVVLIGDREFVVEVPMTPEAQEMGLSGREYLAAGTGMLFAYDSPKVVGVWMPDMNFPLDIAWIRNDEVVGVITMDPCTEADQEQCPVSVSPTDVDAFLEVPAGALGGVAEGTPVMVTQRP
jgi:uncharacterized membrane protein (UPF0127 family)